MQYAPLNLEPLVTSRRYCLEELLSAVKRVSEGGKYISSLKVLLSILIRIHQAETRNAFGREFEIAIKLANGKSLGNRK